MKKQLLGLMTILTVFGACQKNEVASLSEDVIIHATIENEDATKTVMDENNNILWSENDQIIAFMKSSYGYKYQVKPAFVGKSYADFSMVSSGNGSDISAGNEWEHNVVYYPYSENIECLKSGAHYELEVNLPSEQVYVPDSFANGSMAMVAVNESNNITFKNVLGGIKLQLKGTQKVASIKIEGRNNEKLSGSAVVTAYTDDTKPAITMSSDGATSVILNCGEGVQLNESTATEFILCLPPVLFSKGFSVIIKSSQGDIYTVDSDKTNTVLRSSILIMPELTLNGVVSQSNYYIDEYGINHGEGIEIDGVVWAPVNCGYKAASSTSNGFTRGKLYQWGRKYGQGFADDEIVPTIEYGPVMLSVGQSEANANIRYKYNEDNTEYPHNDWLITQNNNLWNSGTETEPIKSQYDPCPDGWRVPTHSELKTLVTNYTKNETGWFFYGTDSSLDSENALFLPFTGDGWWGGSASKSSSYGYYWSSSPSSYTSSNGTKISKLIEFSNFSGDLVIGNSNNYQMRSNAYSVRCVKDNSQITEPDVDNGIVENIYFSKNNLILAPNTSYTIITDIYPENAKDAVLTWSSSNTSIVEVDQTGKVTAYNNGTAIVKATSTNGVTSSCTVKVIHPGTLEKDYVDEFGVNYGKGIAICGTVWAPVNCGYKAASSTSNGFTRGKLYQWGRKYGQGFADDEIVPTIEYGPVMLSVGQSEANANIRYKYNEDNTEYPHNDWLITQNNNLWNSGTETEPIKSQYDPCPDGWRVPTHSELKTLVTHYTKDTEGWIFYGAYDARENVNTLFLPFTGDGWWGGSASKSSSYGYYWSSSPSTYTYKGASYSELVEFSNFSGDLTIDNAINYKYRSNAYSVRCVQE